MITNRFSAFTKKQLALIKAIDIFQLLLGLLLLGIVFVAMIISLYDTERGLNIWTIIMGVAGIISLVEIIVRKVFNKQSIVYSFLLLIYRNRTNLFHPTNIQIEICSWINKKIQSGNGVLIYGKANMGKTTSVFIYLSQYIKHKEILRQFQWVKNIIYIDCKNNKSDILDFFSQGNENTYEKSLIIIDNIEAMGETFFENLVEIIKSSIGAFILLADVKNIQSDIYKTLEIKEVKEKYGISLYNNDSNFIQMYETLTNKEKLVLLIIYYISMSVTLISVSDLLFVLNKRTLFNYVYWTLNSLIHKNIITFFPFDHSYILLGKQQEIVKNQSQFWETEINTTAIFKLLQKSGKFPESAWLSFIHLPYDILKGQPENKKKNLFQNALKCGNFLTLHKALQNELIYCPEKEILFLYEIGTLYFYNSCQEKAFLKYNQLLNKAISREQQHSVILRIIETTHGDINNVTKKNIELYLKALQAVGEPYSLFAAYWKLHIETERGIFNISQYTTLLQKLIMLNEVSDVKDIQLELIKRCYTDIIRSYHILFSLPEQKIIDNFLKFLLEIYDATAYSYYKALYVDANTEHYINILGKLLKKENCEYTYKQAVDDYNIAMSSGYENIKSVSACELKFIDLKLFNPDNIKEFDYYKAKINKFLSNAEINKVSVHIAYCKTLLAKLCMIKNLHDENYYLANNKKKLDSNIKTYLRDAKKIYIEFSNEYGIIRVEFLEILYKIATYSRSKDINNFFNKSADILRKHSEYQRESAIIHAIKTKIAENDGLHMFIIAIIKAYPIIMQ